MEERSRSKSIGRAPGQRGLEEHNPSKSIILWPVTATFMVETDQKESREEGKLPTRSHP
jgi:hypothetical protein